MGKPIDLPTMPSTNPVYAKASTVPTVVATTDPGLSMHSGSSAVYAAPLLSSHGPGPQPSSSLYDSYDNREGLANRKRRKQMMAGLCCCCCALFLLLFFLIPRVPQLVLVTSTIVAKGSYQLTQQWQIINRNPYGIILSNVNTMITSPITNKNSPYYGQYVVGYGQLQAGSDSTVSIGSTNDAYVNIVYNFTSTTPYGVIAASAAQCCANWTPYFTTGSFDFSTTVALHDYHDIGIGSTTLLMCCS